MFESTSTSFCRQKKRMQSDMVWECIHAKQANQQLIEKGAHVPEQHKEELGGRKGLLEF